MVNWSLTKVPKYSNGKREVFSTYNAGITGIAHMGGKNKPGPFHTSCKNWIYEMNHKSKCKN